MFFQIFDPFLQALYFHLRPFDPDMFFRYLFADPPVLGADLFHDFLDLTLQFIKARQIAFLQLPGVQLSDKTGGILMRDLKPGLHLCHVKLVAHIAISVCTEDDMNRIIVSRLILWLFLISINLGFRDLLSSNHFSYITNPFMSWCSISTFLQSFEWKMFALS